jgi:hypothetical protein
MIALLSNGVIAVGSIGCRAILKAGRLAAQSLNAIIGQVCLQ